MQKLVTGIHQFQNNIFSTKQQLFEDLVGGQHPLALFITCSDSRISPNLITQTDPGELFIIRNAGNIVPAFGVADGGEAATIEYAVNVLKVKDIVICGHSHCGAMGGLLNQDKLGELPVVRAWLSHAAATYQLINEKYSDITDPAELLTTTVERNVLVQLDNLRTHPSVAAALSKSAVTLHGWVYKFETGQVFSHDSATDEFVPIEGTGLASPPATQ